VIGFPEHDVEEHLFPTEDIFCPEKGSVAPYFSLIFVEYTHKGSFVFGSFFCCPFNVYVA